MPAPASPLLSYSLLCSVGDSDGVTYVNVGQPATLTLVVSNAGAPVTLDSLTLAFSLGTDGTDLAASAGNVTVVLPSAQWTAAWSANGLTLTPPGGSMVVGTTTGLTFDFQVSAVNSIVGTTQIDVTETASDQTAYVAPFAIPMLPAGFVLTDLVATPAQISPGGVVTLTWSGTPGQVYAINYFGGPAAGVSVVAPSGGIVVWTSPPVGTSASSATFVVSATVQSTTVQASVSVLISAPQILTFPQPDPFYGASATLVWTTVNATSCQLWANGSPVDLNAPANSPAGGYVIQPTLQTTTYELFACQGSIVSAPQSVVVDAHFWAPSGSVAFPDPAVYFTLALTADGSTLFSAGEQITQFSTAPLAVTSTNFPGFIDLDGINDLAVRSDGKWVFGSQSGVQSESPQVSPSPSIIVYAPSSPGTSSWVTSNGNIILGTLIALSPDNATLYTGFYNNHAATNASFLALDLTNMGIPNSQVAIAGKIPWWGDTPAALQVAPNGDVYAVVQPDGGPAALLALSFSQQGYTGGCAVAANWFALSPDSQTIYLWAYNADSSALTIAAIDKNNLSLPPRWQTTLFTPPAGVTALPVGLATEPSGGIFALFAVTGLSARQGSVGNGLNIFGLSPDSGAASLLYQNATIPAELASVPLVADATGANLYLAMGGQIVKFTQTTAANGS